jgi:2-polyprenyl-3-methyl-5-hydroxy-6-metoxy-1,4-benzoquinol methylase
MLVSTGLDVVPTFTVGRDLEQIEWTPEQVAAFWDFESRVRLKEYFSLVTGGRVAAHISHHLKGANAVLDYGCGPGYMLPHLSRHAGAIYGLDFSTRNVEEARRYTAGNARVKFVVTLAERHLLNRKFDVITAVEVIEHLNEEYLEVFFRIAREMAAAGGTLIITTPNREDITRNMQRCPCCAAVFHRTQHVRSWSADTLRAAVEANGFQVIEVRECHYRAPAGTPGRMVMPLLKPFLGIPHLWLAAKKSSAERTV